MQFGDIYRLVSATDNPYAAFEYLSEDKSEAVLFVFGKSVQFTRINENIRLEGLCEEAMYEVEGVGIRSGRGLMKVGLRVVLKGDMDSHVIRIHKLNAEKEKSSFMLTE